METPEKSLVCKYKIKHYTKELAFWFRSVIHNTISFELKNRSFGLHIR